MLVVLLFSIFLLIVKQINIYDLFLNLTTLSFWLNSKNRFDWYVPAILVMYIISQIIIKNRNKIFFILISTVLINIIVILFNINYLLIFTTRLFVFEFGILIANFIEEKRK